MSSSIRVLLFGDQTYDFAAGLQDLLRKEDNPILTAFLSQAHYAIRAEFNQTLPSQERKSTQTANLAQLLHRYRQGVLNPAFHTALACIYQLGTFISQYGEVGMPYPNPHETLIIGVCTGTLAAAAVSSCCSLSELLPAAIQTVQVAFRLALCTVDVRNRIELPREDVPQSWSRVFPGLESSEAALKIQEFCQATGLSEISQPWIGATAPKATTISGPPSVLQKVQESPSFSILKSKAIPVYTPSHASHIFAIDDVKKILETTLELNWSGYTAKIPVVSGATGRLIWAGNLRGLLERALCECLMEPIRWDAVLNELPNLLSARGIDQVSISAIGSTAENSLLSSLKSLVDIAIDTRNSAHQPELGSTVGGKEKLAIIGMSGRFPEARSPEAFWDILYQGLDVCKPVPPKRWNVDTHVEPSGKAHNKGATPWGCWLDFAGEFDPRFFSISPKEAPQMDPAQRMSLMSTFEAMEQAGMVPGNTPSTQIDRVGVFHGVTSNDYMESNSAQDIDTYFIMGGNRGFIPGRINFCFEFCGPSYTNDTACSSSLAAIHLACNSLWRGDCDTAVAGGTNMIFNPDGHAGLDKGFFLSRTGNCKAFDDNADGYCRAEGVGTVFIKRLSDALADKDPILAVILDTKTNHSALSDSMTRPHVGAQVKNMEAVLNNACVDPNTLSYIEMHGTGTQVGDAVEMESVLTVFAPHDSFRGKENPLWVGTAKANVGHGEGVSGVTSLVKVLLMMKNNTIPPHCGIKPGSKINRTFPDLAARNVHIAFKPTPWLRGSQPRRVLINNFSAAGGNTALLLEDAPVCKTVQDEDPRSSHIVTVSGHVATSLKKNLVSMLDYISREEDNGLSLPQLSWTTTARRFHRIHRVCITGSSIGEIKTGLQEAIDRGDGITRAKSRSGVLLAFTGQGSQYMGMGSGLYQSFPRFHADIHRFDQLSRSLGFDSFVHVFESNDGDIDQYPPAVAQLAMCSLQMALGNLLKSFGIKPTALIGHSLGQYAVLNQAGVLSVADTLYLVGKRAELLQHRCNRGTHAMLAIKCSRAVLEEALVGLDYNVACINGPEDTVLSGANKEIDSIRAIVAAKGFKCTKLQVPFAFHSAQVDPILESFTKIASSVTFHRPTVPILCPLTGTIIKEAEIFTASYLAQHCRESVNIVAALQTAKSSKLIDEKTLTIEIGPHPVVSGMVKATLGTLMKCLPILQRNKSIWSNLTSALGALYINTHEIDWVEYHSAFKACHRVLELPAYGWDLKEYYIPYEGDWSLHKHKIECHCADNKEPANHTGHNSGLVKHSEPIQKSHKPEVEEVTFPKTTNVHRLVENTLEPLGALLVVETDISRPDTSRVAAGHKVNNIPLATPSFYSDIAIVLGKYLMSRLRPGYPGVIDVSDLVCDKALVPHGQGPQFLRTSVKMEWAPKSAGATKHAKCEFYSVDETGKTTTKHAWCVIRFQDTAHLRSIQARVPEFASKIARLRHGSGQGQFVKYSGNAGYKLMSSVAQFHPDYKLLDDVVLDESTSEACSKLNFSTVQPGGTFAAHPAFVDAITQVGGFAMNAKDSTDLDQNVFVNHGWNSFQIFEELKADRTYEVYVQMKHHEEDLYHGDTVVLDGSTVVAFFQGVSLRFVPRKALRMVLQQMVDKATRALKKRGAAPADKASAPLTKVKPAVTPAPTPVSKAKSNIVVEPKPSSLSRPAVIHTELPIPAKQTENNPQFAAALAIVAEESGIAISELTDESYFADIGVDSLLSMCIASRFREELGMNLEADFSIFIDLPTVKDLKEFFLGNPGGADAQEPVMITDLAEIDSSLTSKKETVVLTSTNAQIESAYSAEIQPAAVVVPIGGKSQAPIASETAAVLSALEIISDESGIAISDLSDDTNFVDIGIDSLLSMCIASRFREELNLDLDADFSMFTDFPTVKDLRVFLNGNNSEESTDDDFNKTNTPEDSESEHDPVKNRSDYCKPTTSVILQGVPKTASKTIFLLPDGSGSASAYLTLPRLKGDYSVVGLNCPYARDPENMNCTHTAMMNSFCTEIRRRQPSGPYYLGGWSSGGAFAFVCAETLVSQGQEIHGLVIVDAPVPCVLEQLPQSFYDYSCSLGIFGHEQPPPYLIPHFRATVDVMLPYKVSPLKTKHMPKVGILWATEILMGGLDMTSFESAHFMVNKRVDFGPDGWDVVLPGAEFLTEKAVGCNHFTLMSKENAHQVSSLIEWVMA